MGGLLDIALQPPSSNSLTGKALGLLYPNGYQGGLFGMTPLPQQMSEHEKRRKAVEQTLMAQGQNQNQAALGAMRQTFDQDPMANALAGFVGAIKPIRAFHGSPHNFDKFDAAKIGTGEGAQAYGHGLYFAEREGVAQSYRDALTQSRLVAPNGEVLMTRDAAGNYRSPYLTTGDASYQQMGRAFGDLMEAGGDYATAIKNADPKTRAALEWMQKRGDVKYERGGEGKMYEVNIHADPQRMLDWDKPVGQQAPEVLKAAKEYGHFDPQIQGQTFYRRAVQDYAGGEDPLVVGDLMRSGVPGIRYLDAGSRAKGDGSRNYVIFDPSIVEIIRKYGLLGPAAVGGGLLAQPGE